MQTGAASNWLDTQAQIEELSSSLDYEQAAALGPQYLEEIRTEFGAASMMLAEAHLLVAITQRDAGNYGNAEDNTLEAVRIIRQVEDENSPSLVGPLTTLGGIYQAAGRHELALVSFADARSISRRNEGLLNQQQLQLVDRMTEAAIAIGDLDEGLKLQREARNIVARYYGEESREYLDASYHYLEWLGRLNADREHPRAVINIRRLINDHFDNDPRLRIELLQKTAVIYRNNPNAMQSPDRTKPQELELALKLLDDLEEPDPHLHAELQRDLGDWYSAFNQTSTAERRYRDAWELLEQLEDGDGESLRKEWFGSLVAIRAAPLSSWIISASPSAPWGHVELAFTVNTNGRASDIRVLDSDPQGLLDGAAVRQISRSVFRPTFVDGNIAPAAGNFTWRYQYDPQALDRLGIELAPND